MVSAAELAEQKAQLIAYLLSKVKAGDFHAVADAAMDIREIDAQTEILSATRLNVPSIGVTNACNHPSPQAYYSAVEDAFKCSCGMVRDAHDGATWMFPAAKREATCTR